MDIGYEQARALFEQSFDPLQSSAYLHPDYIRIDALRDPQLHPVFFVHQSQGKIFYYPCHRAKVPEQPFWDLQSAYGYGGALSSSSNGDFLKQAWDTFGRWCQANQILAEFVRFHPLLDNCHDYPGVVLQDRQTVWIDLNNKDIFSTYKDNTKWSIKKARKQGLTLEWGNKTRLLDEFPNFYLEHMATLNADNFYFFNHEYIRNMILWEHCDVVACYREDQMISAALFIQNNATMEYHLSAANTEGRKSCATHLLLHEAALRAQNNGLQRFFLGGGTSADADNPLFRFKVSYSPLSAPFKIGKRVYLPTDYERLKHAWSETHDTPNNRVLFYR